MNEVKCKGTIVSIESTMISEEFGNLLVPVGIFKGFSSDKEDLCDEDCEGVLMSEDTTAICTDSISEMKRADE